MKTAGHLMRLVILLTVASLVHAENLPVMHLNIVPLPVKVKPLPGTFTLNNQTRIVAVDEESRRIAGLLNDFLLSNHGFHLEIETTAPKRGRYISFTQVGGRNLPAEGYRLVVTPVEIRVVGQPAGLFYGMQTLTQLLPLGLKPSVVLPAVDITDYPRFHYRGVLLDVGRHFFSVTFLKNFLDLMAQYKINRFQWHLTDDEGWRIEIKKYRRLTEIGSQREGPSEGENLDPYVRGYYTQEQIKDIVAYAQARFITVIPEIEMPGHSQVALAAYPRTGMHACTVRGEHWRRRSQRRFLPQGGNVLIPAKCAECGRHAVSGAFCPHWRRRSGERQLEAEFGRASSYEARGIERRE